MNKQELQHIIGDNLYHIRTQQKLTREHLAEKVGVYNGPLVKTTLEEIIVNTF